jgi:hypothetical protein
LHQVHSREWWPIRCAVAEHKLVLQPELFPDLFAEIPQEGAEKKIAKKYDVWSACKEVGQEADKESELFDEIAVFFKAVRQELGEGSASGQIEHGYFLSAGWPSSFVEVHIETGLVSQRQKASMCPGFITSINSSQSSTREKNKSFSHELEKGRRVLAAKRRL